MWPRLNKIGLPIIIIIIVVVVVVVIADPVRRRRRPSGRLRCVLAHHHAPAPGTLPGTQETQRKRLWNERTSSEEGRAAG